jgi:Skp family chaperone for outer membrane proteins
MKQYSKRGALTAAALVFCLATGAFTGSATMRPAQAQNLAFGIVDEDKLGDSFTKYKEAISKIDARIKQLDSDLEGRKLLNEAEGTRYDTLILKESRSAAEETELKNLIKSGLDRQAEFIRLSGSANRSEADNNRIKELQTLGQSNLARYDNISEKIYNQLKKQQDATDQQFTTQAKKVIEEVAKEKNLSVVMRLRAVVWSAPTIDITDEVIKRLNK